MSNLHDDASVVVVGGGLAGARTCEELRRQGFRGAITLVSAETGPLYDRPPLSKGRDGVDRAELAIDLDALDIRVLRGVRAVGLDGVAAAGPGSSSENSPDGPIAVLVDDTAAPVMTADAMVAATGASPIVPSGWPVGPTVRVLRTRDDAAGLWAALDAAGPGARVAVLGGSWIGMEFATVASGLGAEVTIYERAAWLLPMLPPEAGRTAKLWCDAAGVQVRLGAAVDSIEIADEQASRLAGARPPSGAATPTSGGPLVRVTTAQSAEQFDLVLIALGVAPITAWLASAGLPLSTRGALKVDAHLRTRDPRVIGVGDAVERWSPRYQQELPAGHWQDARDEPVVAAASVLAALDGRNQTAELGDPYDAVPYFWSELFGHTIQFSGFVSDYRVARMVVRGSLNEEAWTLCWLDSQDRLQAVLACDRPRDAITARKALAAHPEGLPSIDPTVLADADAPLATSLKPATPPAPGER